MKLALFGGTFDPIHYGHIEAACKAAEAHEIERVLVIPSGNPPHKTGICRASYKHRYRMVELACECDQRLIASRLEEPKGNGQPHYSIDTINRVKDEMQFQAPLKFIIGSDAFAELGLWRNVSGVIVEVEFLVVQRPESSSSGINPPEGACLQVIQCNHSASSREIRHRVKIGGTLGGLTPDSICKYIWENSLYRL